MTNKIDIHGIKYYATPQLCISHFEKKPWVEKTISMISSFGTMFMYAVNRVSMIIGGVQKGMAHYQKFHSPNPLLKD